jgi:hypothetical protein
VAVKIAKGDVNPITLSEFDSKKLHLSKSNNLDMLNDNKENLPPQLLATATRISIKPDLSVTLKRKSNKPISATFKNLAEKYKPQSSSFSLKRLAEIPPDKKDIQADRKRVRDNSSTIRQLGPTKSRFFSS